MGHPQYAFRKHSNNFTKSEGYLNLSFCQKVLYDWWDYEILKWIWILDKLIPFQV